MRLTNTTSVFPGALSRQRRRLYALALSRCLEIALLAIATGCSSDWTVGTIPKADQQPPLRTSFVSEGMYATDGKSLYALDDHAFSAPTPFRGCALEVVEIALDASGVMFGAGYEKGNAALYRIDPASGACTVVHTFQTSAPWSVGYLHQTLLGDDSGSLIVFDAWSGMFTYVMTTMPTTRESRDIVLGIDGSTYVSALVDRNGTKNNVLEMIDPDSARVLQSYPLPDATILEGLATASGFMYGFTRDGHVVRVSIENDAVSLSPVETKNGPARFTGAASAAVTTPR